MNPRQRRGVLLMIVAGLGAVAVFFAVLGYVGDVRARAAAEVGEMTRALQLQVDVEPFQPVSVSMLREVEVPRRWAAGTFIRDVSELRGKVAAGPLTAGSYLQRGMVVEAPALGPGQREIAIMIDAETGVAGKVTKGSIVDVYATFDAVQGRRDSPPCAVRILDRVQVIDVGEQRTTPGDRDRNTSEKVVPVTFALNADQTLDLTYAESFARKLRLALVGGAKDARRPAGRKCDVPTVRR